MIIDHVIITRFCCRISKAYERGMNPLDPANVEHRMRMLRVCPLASLRAQTSHAFTWVIAIDRDLPLIYRDELAAAVSDLPRVVFHEFEVGTFRRDFGGFEWLRPYLASGDGPVLTTFLDDDDALAAVFIEKVQQDVRTRTAAEEMPLVSLYGSNRVLQWDFFSSKLAPLGYSKPWHKVDRNGHEFDLAAGLTLYCASSRIDLSVSAFNHATVRAIGDHGTDWYKVDQQLAQTVDRRREQIQSAVAATMPLGADTALPGYKSLDVTLDVPLVAVNTNHLRNMQQKRLFDEPASRTLVVGQSSFPGVAMDFAHASKVLSGNRRSLGLLWRATRTSVINARQNQQQPPLKRALEMAKAPIKAALGVWRLR